MNITIQSIHFTANAELLEFVEKKVQKLETFNPHILNAEVYLKLDRSESEDNKVVEMKINIPGVTLFSGQRATTFEEAADEAMDSLIRQIRKHKTKEQVHTTPADVETFD